MGFDQWLSHDNFFELNPTFSRNGGPPEKFDGESSEIVIDETIRFIRDARQNEKPFLAVVWFGSPHEPYSGLPKDLALYDDLPKTYQAENRFSDLERNRRTCATTARRGVARTLCRDHRDGPCHRNVAGVSARAVDLRDNTLLWYCGDNGTPEEGLLASPLRGHKGQMYEGGIRVPGVIEWPARIPQPRVSEVNAVTSDILPTICELTGQPLPNRPLDGIGLKQLIDGDINERSEPDLFLELQRRSRARHAKPYIDPELQVGDDAVWSKLMQGIAHTQLPELSSSQDRPRRFRRPASCSRQRLQAGHP